MQHSNFTTRILKDKKHNIHKIIAVDEFGKKACYFLLLDATKSLVFKKNITANDMIDLTSYGKIIASCYGDHATEKIRSLLK